MPTETTDVACTTCGCVCDDLAIETENNRVTGVRNACKLSERWYLQEISDFANQAESTTTVAGREAEFDHAVLEAARILSEARAPLIYGLSRSSTPGQRAAVKLADRISASIDTTASTCHAPAIIALQNVGESTCSLGEVKNRADLVVYWGSNPMESHPRHIERLVDAKGMFIPNGRSDRHVVVVDTRPTETSAIADTFIQVEPGRDLELIWALRAILAGHELDRDSVAGLSIQQIHDFADLLKSSRYGCVFFGLGISRRGVPHANVEALLRLTTELNQHTRFVVRRMRIPGDVAGADSVLCWQTGFPFSVNLSRGYPRYNPGEYTADVLLKRREVDAVLLVGSEGVEKLSKEARDYLQTIPNILLEYPTVDYDQQTAVRFTTAIYGVHRTGTAYRMDEVPIPLRSFLESELPSDEEVLNAIVAAYQPGEPE